MAMSHAAKDRKYKLQFLAVNSESARIDYIDDRKCVVFAVALMTEGVHVGSQGALYYGPQPLANTATVWDSKPVTLGHPTKNKQYVTANSADMLNKSQIGILLNSRWEKGKLRAEAWIYADKAEQLSPGLVDNLQNGTVYEVSLGAFVDTEVSPGEWGEETYDAVVTNIRPDHLAIILDGEGACSIKDGAGINVVNKAQADSEMVFVTHAQQSFDDIRQKLSDAAKGLGIGDCCYIEAVFAETVIYSCYQNGEYCLCQYPYTVTDTGVLVEKTMTPVKKVITYEPTMAEDTGTVVANEEKPMTFGEYLKSKGVTLSADAAAAVDALPAEVGEAVGGLFDAPPPAGEDAPPADAPPADASADDAPPADVPPVDAPPADAPPVEDAPAVNAAFAGYTKEQIDAALGHLGREKAAAVARLTANKACAYSKEQLDSMDHTLVINMAKMVYGSGTDYTINGAGPAPEDKPKDRADNQNLPLRTSADMIPPKREKKTPTA